MYGEYARRCTGSIAAAQQSTVPHRIARTTSPMLHAGEAASW
jgi:hypothetical protein